MMRKTRGEPVAPAADPSREAGATIRMTCGEARRTFGCMKEIVGRGGTVLITGRPESVPPWSRPDSTGHGRCQPSIQIWIC